MKKLLPLILLASTSLAMAEMPAGDTVRAVDTDGLASDWADTVCFNATSKPQKLIIRFVTGAN